MGSRLRITQKTQPCMAVDTVTAAKSYTCSESRTNHAVSFTCRQSHGCEIRYQKNTKPLNPVQDPGQRLRRARERLLLKYRDVEVASQKIADKYSNDEFSGGTEQTGGH